MTSRGYEFFDSLLSFGGQRLMNRRDTGHRGRDNSAPTIFLCDTLPKFCDLLRVSELLPRLESQIERRSVFIWSAWTNDTGNDSRPRTPGNSCGVFDCVDQRRVWIDTSAQGGMRVAQNALVETNVDHETQKPLVLGEFAFQPVDFEFVCLRLALK